VTKYKIILIKIVKLLSVYGDRSGFLILFCNKSEVNEEEVLADANISKAHIGT